MTTKKKTAEEKPQKYIVRADRAGVFFGEIEKVDGSTVTMRNVRKVWYWKGACAVEELAVHGVANPNCTQMTVEVAEMTILGAIQIIPCTDEATRNLEGVKVWSRH